MDRSSFLLLISICALRGTLHADPNAAAAFAVKGEILRTADKVPPLGANAGGGRYVSYAGNNMIKGGGNEPISWSTMYRVVNPEGKSFQIDGRGGLGWYQSWCDGFLSGAKVRIYRLVDKAGKPLPLLADPKWVNLDTALADHVILVGEGRVLAAGEAGFTQGGWVVDQAPEGRQTNRVYLAAEAPELQPLDYAVVEKTFDAVDMNWVHPRVRPKGKDGQPRNVPVWPWVSIPEETVFSFVPHPGKVPAEMVDPGRTCLKLEAVAGPNQIYQTPFYVSSDPKHNVFYGQFEPGAQYRLEVWLRQEGLGEDGSVGFSIHPATEGHAGIKARFAVNGEWQRCIYDFTGPERPTKAQHYGPSFSFAGPGTLWMDNARLFRYDKPEDLKATYVPGRTVLDELLASQPATGPKGSHRGWVLDRDMTMDSILSLYTSSQFRSGTVSSQSEDMTLAHYLMFDYATGDSPQTRMVPHIVIQHILHDEADWQHFVEYLAAPYDPGTDTPHSKPWAYRRFVQRGGNGTPWTDEFREIIVEFGNETWHNGANEDWLGFSTFKAIHKGGTEYGLFATYLIDTIKKSEWWKLAHLDDKIHFNLGGNYSAGPGEATTLGYVELAMQKCPQARYAGHANYVGPKWETGDQQLKELNDTGLMSVLVDFQVNLSPSQARMAAGRDELNAKGLAYEILAYEGGPSGYVTDPRKDPAQAAVAELYGKSLAMGVGAFDAWMGSYVLGWTYQDYLGFAQGTKWSSHTMMCHGFRPHVGWLALTLRNRFASGDLMKVEAMAGPTFTALGRKGNVDVPLIGVYAMRDGDRWSIFVVSRKLNATVDGQEMGDGYNKVSIQLPFTSASEVTLHRLTGDPRSNNTDAQKVRIESLPMDAKGLSGAGVWTVDAATGGGAGGMPPASIFLYVFKAAK